MAVSYGTVTMRDEHWAHGFLSTGRVPSPPTVPEVRRPIRWWSLSEKFVLLGSVSGDGICSVDLPRESSRHRSLPRFHRRQALPHGIPRLDVGRCERSSRLANLRRLCASFDRDRSPALCARSDRRRSGSESICVGLHDHRLVPSLVSAAKSKMPRQIRCSTLFAGIFSLPCIYGV